MGKNNLKIYEFQYVMANLNLKGFAFFDTPCIANVMHYNFNLGTCQIFTGRLVTCCVYPKIVLFYHEIFIIYRPGERGIRRNITRSDDISRGKYHH